MARVSIDILNKSTSSSNSLVSLRSGQPVNEATQLLSLPYSGIPKDHPERPVQSWQPISHPHKRGNGSGFHHDAGIPLPHSDTISDLK